MAAWILVLLLGAITVQSHRRGRALGDPALRRLLVLLAVALPAQALSLRMATAGTSGVAHLPLALAAALGVLAWTAIVHLVAQGARKRDLFLRIPLLVFAAIGLLWDSPLTAATFATLGTLSYRWRARFSTVGLFQLGMAALALVALTSWLSPDLTIDRLQGWTRAVAELALATSMAAWWHVLLGALALLGAFVRDPTLGIRRVSHRLTLSHLLVAGVPLALTLLLWAITTLLGVSQERAAVGARALESEGQRLLSALAAAVESPGAPRDELTTMAAARTADWPALRVWWREGRTLERVTGDAVDMEGALASWVDSLQSLPATGLVVLGHSTFIGAAHRASGRSSAGAVALLPLRPTLAGFPTRIAGGRLTVIGTESVAPHSTPEGRARRAGVTTDGDTVVAGNLLQGLVWVEGLRYGPSGWTPARLPLSSHASARDVFSGLYHRARESQLALVPLSLLVFAAALFLGIIVCAVMIVSGMGRSITDAIGVPDRADRRRDS